MSNKKSIRNIIIICVILVILLAVGISIMKKYDNNEIAIYDEEEFFSEDLIIRDKYEYNEFEYYNISTEQLLQIYLTKFRNDCLNDTEAAFNSLDKEYRERKFGTYEKFVEYVNAERDNIIDAEIQTYKVSNNDNYEEYILEDQFGRNYIFKITAVMEYTVMLDTYTIPTLSFKEKYNEADNEEKAALNLNKFLEAIEKKNYEYSYSKLYDTFKNNNFPTQADFENYINQNWLNYEDIKTVKVEDKSGIYTCKLELINEENLLQERTFMIQLEAETEYKVSFTI